VSSVVTAAQARAIDAHLIEDLGVPGIALMETASRALAECIRDRFATEAHAGIAVVCGPGNNGGDGYGAARWLHAWGLPVHVWPLSETSGGDAAIMREAARRAGVPEADGIGRAGVVVDAVFGTGLSREVSGRFAEVVVRMDTHPAPVVAADLPSGLCSDTGRVLGTTLTAAHTVTFGAPKRGLFCGEGPLRSGGWTTVHLGDAPGAVAVDASLTSADEVATRWPRRGETDYKTRSGHLLVVAGSTAMAGAAVLTCLGALAAGSGLVTLCTPRGALARLGALPPEVMVVPAGDGDLLELHRPLALERYSAVAVGPGLGGGVGLPPHTEMALASWWSSSSLPMVFDADGLAVVAGPAAGPRVRTPHAGEASRRLGSTAAVVQADRFGAARALGAGAGVTLLKGRHTLVDDGSHTWVNPTGAPTLATGGSGDVLTGVVGALLARGVGPVDAGRLGAWVHGRAGELLAAERTEGWTARDIAAAIGRAVASSGG
jgi:NAD(P)H-hydrate epimerase